MSVTAVQLEAGGMLPAGTKVDAGATETVVARIYHHPALGGRPVVRLTSDRLGEAEDLAMEFLGFEAPAVSSPIALQQRRSLGFAAWALINDPGNARYALDLVKRMKAAARQARSKPGHAWDAYVEMAKDLGRSARHFLPPFWEEAGRTFKDLGNSTYAGRALNKSMEAERAHALPADRARRRDVILEFVLSGCLSGNALSEYGNDLQAQYAPAEAFAIFRDLCVRRTRGGMAPWATLPKDFNKLAKAAGLDGDAELESWLEEVIDSPAMGRAPHQFWKACAAHCRRIVARSPAFAVALLRHTRPEERYYGESKLGPWFDLLEDWGVLEYLWEDEHRGAPPLGEPIADWFGRVVRDRVPAPTRTLQLLEKLAPRLQAEAVPLTLSVRERFRTTDVDIDVLEACLVLGIRVADLPPKCDVTFAGWLSAAADHPFRNQDLVASAGDGRFRPAILRALEQALACRGVVAGHGYGQTAIEPRAFPMAAGDRPGIKALWREHTSGVLSRLDGSGLASFEGARQRLASTLWPEALRLFPDVAEQLEHIDPTAMLQTTLRAGVFDEYGWPALEEVVDRHQIKAPQGEIASCLHPMFPQIVVSDKVHAYVVGGDGAVKQHEIRLPKKAELMALVAIGEDLAVLYRDEKYHGHLFWASNPSQHYERSSWGYWHNNTSQATTILGDGGVFLGQQAVRPGGKELPQAHSYYHDGERFWRVSNEYDPTSQEWRWKIAEVDPRTGKQTRESVPPWFEETEGGTIEPGASELLPAPKGTESSPLGTRDGLLGWKAVKRRDGSYLGVGIDGRRWDRPLLDADGSSKIPVALLRQPGTDRYLPVTGGDGKREDCQIWDPEGSTIVADLQDLGHEYARGQVAAPPLIFWHFLKVRDEASSRTLRAVGHDECANLIRAAAADRVAGTATPWAAGKVPAANPLTTLLPVVKGLLPTAPERLVVGVARVVEHAEREAAAFAELRDRAIADAKNGPTASAAADHRRSDLAAAQWGLEHYHIYGAEGPISVSDHLLSVARFLKGDREAGDLPRTNYNWFPMLEKLPLRCWQTYWRAQAAKAALKNEGDVPWLEFLKLWHEVGIAGLPGRFAVMEGHPEGAKKQSWGRYDVQIENGASFSLRNGEDRFIAVENQAYHHQDHLPYRFLRYSTSESPGEPPGFRVKHVRTLKTQEDLAEIATFLAAAESRTEPPLPTRKELEEAAVRLGVSPAEIGLVWIGGLNLDSYEHNFLPGLLRQAMGLKAAEASSGRQALRNLDESVRDDLYESVVASGCATPFADDRGPVLRNVEEAWLAKTPKRLPLEAALQTRLSALSKSYRWEQSEQGELLTIAADPANHAALRPREIRIEPGKGPNGSGPGLTAKKNEQVVTGPFLRSIVQLVALVHAETPAGNPARASMPELIRQAGKLLEHPGTLLELRTVWLFDHTGRKKPLTPVEWLNKHVGKTTTDAKGGFVHADEGLIAGAAFENQKNHFQNQVFLAFRPAKLKDEGDLARLLGLLSLDAVVEDHAAKGDAITSVVAIQSPGFQKLATAIVAETVPHGQWHQNPTYTAPEVVRKIGEEHNLGEDAAVLYAQLLALPDPTTKNVCDWNGWAAARFKKAAAELVEKKLVLEASRARASRSVFLPGEWIELKAPWLPIERWKLDHLVDFDKTPHDHCPAGGPMVLRPFEDLFAAAWQRVVAGDEPRYEEVKRRNPKKK